jgi:hypothetical protein
VSDRPILFSAPMVRALLEGRKTKTRRVLKPTKSQVAHWSPNFSICPAATIAQHADYDERWVQFEHPKGGPYTAIPLRPDTGDRLYVREDYYQRGHWEPINGAQTKGGRQKWAFVPADQTVLFDPPAEYRKGRHHKDPATVAWHKRLARFMPRRASRLTLTVTDMRVERLQDISEADAIAEGIHRFDDGWHFERNPEPAFMRLVGIDPVKMFRWLWNSINGPEAWDKNPWVTAITFTVEQRNIDA